MFSDYNGIKLEVNNEANWLPPLSECLDIIDIILHYLWAKEKFREKLKTLKKMKMKEYLLKFVG
jgi:hypothetical protein